MGKYYNTTRGPLAVSLSSGKALTIPPKTWIDIEPGDEGSPALVSLKRKGFVKRSVLPDPPAVEEAPAPVPAAASAAPAPAPAMAAPAKAAAPAMEEKESKPPISDKAGTKK